MKKFKILFCLGLLSFFSNKSSATLFYFNGQSSVTQGPGYNNYELNCDAQSKLCCAVDFVTLRVTIFEMVTDGKGSPSPGNGETQGSFDPNSVRENPDQNTTVTMTVYDLK